MTTYIDGMGYARRHEWRRTFELATEYDDVGVSQQVTNHSYKTSIPL